VHVEGGTFTKAVNQIAKIAYNDSMTYSVRINDDACRPVGFIYISNPFIGPPILEFGRIIIMKYI
jgi:hypothetical protein